jgi:autotransporter-associated beta strand protein
VLINSANSYTGTTTITAGNLRITNPTAISAAQITISTASLQLDNGVSISNPIQSTSSSADNMIDSVAAGGTATYAGTVTFATGAQLRMAATGAGATLVYAGTASSGNAFVANQGNIVMVGSSSISASQGLIGRPAGAATISFTLKDSSVANFSGFSNLGNARNVSDAVLTIQDSAAFSTTTTFNLLDTTATAATSTVNLNGGTLTAGSFLKTSVGASQTSVLKFNGGLLKVAGTSNTYIPALAGFTASVENGGANIDTNTFDAVVNAPLVAGSGSTGGLTKNSAGTLTLGGGGTYAGNTTVNAGKLVLGNTLATTANVTLNNDATVELSPTGSGTTVLKTGAVTLAGTNNTVNLQDNKLVTSNNVANVTSLIVQGRNGGGWNGSTGIITGQSTAQTSSFTSIGVASASQVKGIAAGDTAVWAGQTVTGSQTLAMYTYGGDANLDGKINVDDYGHIDSSAPLGISGWFNGDFNYDGKINVDDYGIIDFNVGIQGAPFFSAGGSVGGASGLSGVSAVPEPASLSVLSLGAAAVLGRRRRRRDR